MKFSTSNIALSPGCPIAEFEQVAKLGLSGLEVAPSRVWKNSWNGLTAGAVETFKNEVESAGLSVIGLHSLFFDQPELGLFQGTEARARTLDFMEHLSKLCRDLGGKTLIYGGGRWRRDLPLEDALTESVDFFGELIQRIESHNTVYCFEPLGPSGSDFINSVNDSVRLVKSVGHPSLRVQLDAKALVENDEMNVEIFKAAAPYLVHVHVNEPDLGILGTSGRVDNAEMSNLLKNIGYQGYVSIEQRLLNPEQPIEDLAESARVLLANYKTSTSAAPSPSKRLNHNID